MANRLARNTWIAVGVFAVLLLVVLWPREKQVSVGVQRLELSAVPKDQITRIELSGVKAATLRKVAEGWQVLDPAHADAPYPTDPAQIEPLLQSLSTLKAADFVTERPEKHAEYEVDAAKGERLKVFTAAAQSLDLVVGKAAPRGGCYLRRADQNAVYLSPSPLSWQTRRSVTDFRRKAVVSLKGLELRELSAAPAGASPYVLTRSDANAPWQLVSPKPAEDFRLDGEAVNRLAQGLTDMRAQEFLAAGKASEAQLGFDEAHTVVKAKGTALPAAADAGLSTTPAMGLELHLGRPSAADDSKLASLLKAELKEPGGKLTRVELDKLAANKEHPAHEAASALTHDPARFSWFDRGAWELHPEDQALTAEDLDAVLRLALLVPVRVQGESEVSLVPSWSTEPFSKPVSSLRDLSLFGFDVSKAKGLKLTSGGKTAVALEKENGTWKVVEPKSWPQKNPFEPGTVLGRLSEIRRWRALRPAEGVTAAQAGLDKPAGSVRVTMEDGSQEEVVFGKGDLVKGAVDSRIYVVGEGLRATLKQGPGLFEKVAPPPQMSGAHGLESLPPEIRRQIEQMQAGR